MVDTCRWIDNIFILYVCQYSTFLVLHVTRISSNLGTVHHPHICNDDCTESRRIYSECNYVIYTAKDN